MMETGCPFCGREGALFGNELAYAVYDKYPVTRGHILVIPNRHYADAFDSTREEIGAFIDLITQVKGFIDSEYSPDGYNIAVNNGRAAGQTIMHFHIHIIPRYEWGRAGWFHGVIPER